MLPLAWLRLWQAGALLLMLAIAVGSLLPGPAVATVSVWDKLQHAVGYGVVALWLMGMVRPGRYLHAAAVAFLLGVVLELAQAGLAETRDGDVLDLVANGSGIAVALVLAYLGLGGWSARVERWFGAAARE